MQPGFTFLPFESRNDVFAGANWIKANIPCPVGGYERSSRKTVDQVFEELRRRSVPLAVGSAAMNMVFGAPAGLAPRLATERQTATIGPAPAYARPGHPATLAMWEDRLKRAQLSNNLEEINDILQAILELLYHAAGGQRKEFERVRRDLRAYARTTSGYVLHLNQEELRRLRAAPTPADFPTLRVTPRRHQQAQSRQRRGR